MRPIIGSNFEICVLKVSPSITIRTYMFHKWKRMSQKRCRWLGKSIYSSRFTVKRMRTLQCSQTFITKGKYPGATDERAAPMAQEFI